MKLTPMTCGTIKLDADFATPGHAGDSFRAAVAMFLIEHPLGNVLIDTGNHPAVAVNAASYWGRETASWLEPEMLPTDAVDKQLKRLGLTPRDINHVVLSHMHIDHAGAMCLFPHAKFHIQRAELLAAMWPDPAFDSGWYDIKDFACSRRFDITAHDGNSDIFGDGSISLIRTGGHAVGHQMVLLDLPDTGRVLLPCDAAFDPRQPELLCPPGDPLPQPDAALDFVRNIRKMRDSGMRIIYSHPNINEWNDVYSEILT